MTAQAEETPESTARNRGLAIVPFIGHLFVVVFSHNASPQIPSSRWSDSPFEGERPALQRAHEYAQCFVTAKLWVAEVERSEPAEPSNWGFASLNPSHTNPNS